MSEISDGICVSRTISLPLDFMSLRPMLPARLVLTSTVVHHEMLCDTRHNGNWHACGITLDGNLRLIAEWSSDSPTM